MKLVAGYCDNNTKTHFQIKQNTDNQLRTTKIRLFLDQSQTSLFQDGNATLIELNGVQ